MTKRLSEATIQMVVENDNLVVRNLQVTQGYYRLAQGMRRYMSHTNVNWCAFATHASRTAGMALRHELMPRLLRSAMVRLAGFENTFLFLRKGIEIRDPALTEVQDGRLADAMRQVSQLISDGNIVVFKELAWPFAGYIETFRKDWVRDEGKLQGFLDQYFTPGPLAEGGQDYLIEAFTAYYNARFETNRKRKAELVLHGNLLIGLHEQTRLQPQIEQSLAMPMRLLRNEPSVPGAGRIWSQRKNSAAHKALSKAVTQMMMGITLPNRVLKLGEDIIAPTGVIKYPKELLIIEDERCRELVRMFETGQDTLTGSAAGDWASLRDRMSFVVDFFRSHQQYERMWEAPFSEEQMAAIELGHFPAGPL
jgi:hypothetical protein